MSSSSVISIADIDTHVLFARSRVISLYSARSSENNRRVEKNHEIEKNRRDETEMRMRSREKDHDSRFSTR
jgi:predicted HAD superfamily phosphohydrolase